MLLFIFTEIMESLSFCILEKGNEHGMNVLPIKRVVKEIKVAVSLMYQVVATE